MADSLFLRDTTLTGSASADASLDEDPLLLDNPIWSALCTGHSAIALGNNMARRYPSEIGPLSGIAEEIPHCYEALRPLAGEQDVVVLFSPRPIDPGAGWSVVRGGQLYQMLYTYPAERLSVTPPEGIELRRLTRADAPSMVALAELTEPGPFRLRTIDLGKFYGVLFAEEVVAMAGKRLRLPGFVEVSGVCTHPEARGRGYAALLMSMVMDEILGERKTPFLHVLTTNPAIKLYERLGFAIRQTFHWAVLRPDR